MDCSNFASLAQIQILLIPIGSISRTTFNSWAQTIRTFNEIRLSDVQGDSKDDAHRFMPKPLESGFLLLNYPSHPPPQSRFSLGIFRPSSFPLGVICVASGSQPDSISSIYAEYTTVLSELFPEGTVFPFARNCFVFEEGDGSTNFNMGEAIPGLTIIPSMMGNKDLYVGTLISELCSNILGGFSSFVSVLETVPGNQALNAGMLASMPNFVAARRVAEVNEGLPALNAQHSYPGLSPSSNEPLDVSRIPLKRTSTTGPGNALPSSRSSLGITTAKKRQSTLPPTTSHARLYKVLGDLFLLAGKLMDATIWYNEAVALLKQPNDVLWHASALEGIATANIIEIWTSLQTSSESSLPDSAWATIAEKVLQATSLYSKAAASVDGGDLVADISFLYVSAVLRHSVLLYRTSLSNGLNSFALNSLDTQAENSSGLPLRSDISASLSQAHGPWILHLGPREKIDVLRFIASLYESLLYRRKEAYILRELVSCLMDLFVHGREESRSASLVSSRTSLDGSGERGDREGEVGVREADDVTGNSSIIEIVKYACKVHGVDLGCVQFSDNSGHPPGRSLSSSSRSRKSISNCHFGWPELQIGLVREALAIAEGLPDYPSVVLFALSALRDQEGFVDGDDQYHFHVTASRALATLRRRGDERKLKYWAGNDIVSSIQLMPPSAMRTVIERPWRELKSDQAPSSVQLSSSKRSSTSNSHVEVYKSQRIVVQNESVEFAITLTNTFSFALEITHLALWTTGVPFHQDGCPLTIQGHSSQTITLSGKATESGNLIVRGCVVHLLGAEPCEISVPLLTEDEEHDRLNSLIAAENEAQRPKVLDLNHRLYSSRDRSSTVPNADASRHLELKVVPDQPLLRIRRTTLTNGSVMLYDGETATVRVTLENISGVAVDFFDLSFDDTTKAMEEMALADGQLNVFDAYETEHSLVERPVLSWDRQAHRQKVLPGKEMTVEVKCFGKAGCARGLVEASYAHTESLAGQDEPPPSAFYVRQLPLPLLISVYEMLECHGMDVLPVSSLVVEDIEDNVGDSAHGGEWRSLLARHDKSEWCILALDVRNTYGLAFEVRLTCDEVTTCRVVPPGLTYRLMLPIKRFSLTNEVTSSPIPSLTGRQYVVTSEDSSVHRELFWYREELFKRVHVTWREAVGPRKGELSLRKQRFTTSMLSVLRHEQVTVELSVRHGDQPNGVYQSVPHCVKPNQFVSLEAHIQNRSSTSLALRLSLEAEPSDYVLHEGVLNNVPFGNIDPGSSKTVIVPLVFLAEGHFNLMAQARVIGTEKQSERLHGGQCELTVLVQNA
ncbi:Trs120-domain-containing protein [Schizopora paradoxa]|uniref:Trs120-domain-containing protein n=1 Tax=Schizopora paradoxa TaxID=27342 RepID=A0A0H2RFS4_9AGAM|nr:Trs120-domain-containing protein [Schizopora paradoxa]